jgi:hypothetical protein
MRTHQHSARKTSGTSEWHSFERGVDLCEGEGASKGVVAADAVEGEMKRKEDEWYQ